jgi:hypothetical protein
VAYRLSDRRGGENRDDGSKDRFDHYCAPGRTAESFSRISNPASRRREGARGQRYERALQHRRYQDDLLWERHNESAIKSFEIFRIVPKSRRSVLV